MIFEPLSMPNVDLNEVATSELRDVRNHRLDTKLRRELGGQILNLLADESTEDIVVNADSSIWLKRMGTGFVRTGKLSPGRTASALGTIAAWHGTVANHGRPILETELPMTGADSKPSLRPLSASLYSPFAFGRGQS